jgi:hypothetical protein
MHIQDGSSTALALGVPSSSSSSFTGTAYTPLSQRLRSTSAQRRLQNGRNGSAAGLPQRAQLALGHALHMVIGGHVARHHTALSQPTRIG